VNEQRKKLQVLHTQKKKKKKNKNKIKPKKKKKTIIYKQNL